MIQLTALLLSVLPGTVSGPDPVSGQEGLREPPQGFVSLCNGKDLSGWKGLVQSPPKRAAMSAEKLAAAQASADAKVAQHWRAEGGEIVNDGKGPHLCTGEDYGDFELWVDWKIVSGGDSGIYLRGSPQVQIWDPVNGIGQAKVGSGGLFNNKKNPSKPLCVADRPAGEWNTFFIRMVGEKVTVRLNDQLVVDDVVMENLWQPERPIDARGQIELQTHGGEIHFRNIFLREIPSAESDAHVSPDDQSFRRLFNGRDLSGWMGAVDGYAVEHGVMQLIKGHGGNLLTEEEFSDFVLRFSFRLPPGANNGLAIRAPAKGDAAYAGIELQILEDTHKKYAGLKPYQFHGSAYGIKAAHRGYQRPVGEWNHQEVRCEGTRIQVWLNGVQILDVDTAKHEPVDGRNHPGMHRTKGHIGFCGHNDAVAFRDVRILTLGEG